MSINNYCLTKEHLFINPGKDSETKELKVDPAAILYNDLKGLMKSKKETGVRIFFPYKDFSTLKNLLPTILLDLPIQWSLVPIEDVLLKLKGFQNVQAFGYNWTLQGGRWVMVDTLPVKPFVMSEYDVVQLYMNESFGGSKVVESQDSATIEKSDLIGDTKLKLFGMLLAAFPDVLRRVSREELLFIVGFEIPKMGALHFPKNRQFQRWQMQQCKMATDDELDVLKSWAAILMQQYSLTCDKNFKKYVM